MPRRRIQWQVDKALLWVQTFHRWWRVRLKGVEFASFIFRKNTCHLRTKRRVQKITTPRIRQCSRKWRRWSLCSEMLDWMMELWKIIYSCFEKGCLANREKLTRQCRQWVMVVFTVAWLNVEVFQRDGREQHKKAYSYFLVPCCWIILSLNQANKTRTTLLPTLLQFCGTTFIGTAFYDKCRNSRALIG